MRSMVILIGMLSTACIAGSQTLTIEQSYSIPEWAEPIFERSVFVKRYELDSHINPFCLHADFDGDGKLDFATFVRERSSGKIGIAFIHNSTKAIYIVGAGNSGIHGDDYSWVDAWKVFEKGVVGQGVGEGKPPKLKGDGLLVFKTEAASAILWWNGYTYRWDQQGD